MLDPARNPRVRPGEEILDWGPRVQRLARMRLGMTVTPNRVTVVRMSPFGHVVARDERGEEVVVECWSKAVKGGGEHVTAKVTRLIRTLAETLRGRWS